MIAVDITLPRKNFDVRIQEVFDRGITGIFGPSGSGKTSLMQCIAGLSTPTQGEISMNGKTVFSAAKKINVPVNKRNIGYVFQEGRLFPHLNVEQNLLFGVKKGGNAQIQYNELVEMLKLGHLLKSKPHEISGGERQRVALGRSLLSSPEILLLDEPFSAVDVGLRSQILPFLLMIHQRIAIPMIVVSHDLPDLLKLNNKLCIIQQGQCIGHGDYFELLKKEAAAHIMGLDTIVNSIRLTVEKADENKGLTILSSSSTHNQVRVICEKSKGSYTTGQELQVFIHAEDIALASQFQRNLTIQNQLEGTLVDVVEYGPISLCKVDVGFFLTVEITAESRKRMAVVVGSKVWCLFKSVAIDVAN